MQVIYCLRKQDYLARIMNCSQTAARTEGSLTRWFLFFFVFVFFFREGFDREVRTFYEWSLSEQGKIKTVQKDSY